MRTARSRPSVRRAVLAAGVVALLLSTRARAEDASVAPDVLPYAGVLPPEEPEPDRAVEATVVVDAATGEPIHGASVRACAEDVDERSPRFAPLVGQARTDAWGVAWVRFEPEFHADHWVVTAKGYEPQYAYGYSPPERVRLRPAVPLAARVLDAWGHPVAGADLEAWHGCPHAPAVLAGVTDAAGLCRWDAGGGSSWFLWVRAAGADRQSQSLDSALGEPETVVLDPGFTVRGRLRDEDGAPIYGATVRGLGYPRGPATLTDRDGRFVLHGVGPDDALRVLHPTVMAPEGLHDVERVVEGVDLDLRWTFHGFASAPGSCPTTVRVRDAEGKALAGYALLVIGPDGRASRERTGQDGVLALDLAPGAHRVRPGSPFGEHETLETSVTALDGKSRTLDLVARRRARLRLRGDVPAEGMGLVVPGRTTWMRATDEHGRPVATWLPSEGPAAVRWGTRWFPVGPAVDGVRTATVRLPRPHRLRLQAPWEVGEVGLSRPGAAWPTRYLTEQEVRDGVVTLWEGGRLWLHVEDVEATTRRVVPVDLPAVGEDGVARTIDVVREALPEAPRGTALLRVTRADGSPVTDLSVVADVLRGGNATGMTGGFDESPIEIPGTGRVWVWAPGLQPMAVDVDRPGDQRVVFPAGTIDVVATRNSGGPRPRRALLDGVLHPMDEEGHLVVSGLRPGPHTLIVTHRRGGGIVWRFTLREGERIERLLTLE